MRRGAGDAAQFFGGRLTGFVAWFFLGGIDGDPHLVRRVRFWVAVRLLVLGALTLSMYALTQAWLVTLVAMTGFVVLSVGYFARRAEARRELQRAATRPIEGLAPLALGAMPPRLFPWHALRVLAFAVDAARRGDVDTAERALSDVEIDKLDGEERRFERAVRALAARRRADPRHAALLALEAFPTGAPALDEELARITLENAWHDPLRLSNIAAAWESHDVWPDELTTLGRFRYLIDMKLGQRDGAELPSDERDALGEEAARLGDQELVGLLAEQRHEGTGYRS